MVAYLYFRHIGIDHRNWSSSSYPENERGFLIGKDPERYEGLAHSVLALVNRMYLTRAFGYPTDSILLLRNFCPTAAKRYEMPALDRSAEEKFWPYSCDSAMLGSSIEDHRHQRIVIHLAGAHKADAFASINLCADLLGIVRDHMQASQYVVTKERRDDLLRYYVRIWSRDGLRQNEPIDLFGWPRIDSWLTGATSLSQDPIVLGAIRWMSLPEVSCTFARNGDIGTVRLTRDLGKSEAM